MRKTTPSSQSGHWMSDGQSAPWRPAKIEGLEGRHAEGAALFFIDDRPVEDDFIAFLIEIAMRFDDD